MRLLVTGGSGYLGTHVRRFFDAEDLSRRAHLDILNPVDAARVTAYDAVILYRLDVAPDIVALLRKLEGSIDNATMVALNSRVQIDGVTERRAAAEFLNAKFNLGIDLDTVDGGGPWGPTQFDLPDRDGDNTQTVVIVAAIGLILLLLLAGAWTLWYFKFN